VPTITEYISNLSNNVMQRPIFDFVLVIVGVGLFFYRHITYKRQMSSIKNSFQKYVPNELIQLTPQGSKTNNREVQEVQATILFSDIEGFTHLSERLEPKELVVFLNEYFTALTGAITLQEGIVDKFIGDSVMAIWRSKDGNVRAVNAAREMHKLSAEYARKAKSLYGVAIRTRIGVNTGLVIIGDIGSSARLSFTAIGDQVNLASRLEGANRIYKTSILISGSTAEGLPDSILMREIDLVTLKGKAKPTRIYEICAVSDQESAIKFAELRRWYGEALLSFQNHAWQEALRKAEETLFIFSDDEPTKLLAECCRKFLAHGPPPDWTGSIALKTEAR
jgi:adenylate cyclase